MLTIIIFTNSRYNYLFPLLKDIIHSKTYSIDNFNRITKENEELKCENNEVREQLQYYKLLSEKREIEMNELREKKMFITKWSVISYVNLIHPTLLMYCLNFQMRKRNSDTIIATEDSSEM